MITNNFQIVKSATNSTPTLPVADFDVADFDLYHQQYDQNQTYKTILAKDYSTDLVLGIGQTACLIGCQIISSQYLLSIGVVGLMPVAVVFVPVLGSGLLTLTNINFDNGLRIEDKGKLPIQLLRTFVISASAAKITQDIYQLDSLAKNSFDVVVAQERQYRNLPQPQDNNLFLVVLVVLVVLFGAIAFKKR